MKLPEMTNTADSLKNRTFTLTSHFQEQLTFTLAVQHKTTNQYDHAWQLLPLNLLKNKSKKKSGKGN